MMTSLTTQNSSGPALEQLERLDAQVDRVFLARQHPITGLMPASTANTVHGNYGDAWVRDNVYTVQAIWGLALAWRRQGQRPARVYALEQSVLALMRGLMRSMMAQAAKVERFKASQELLDALHAKYDTETGQPVVADNAWGHLQLDATSLFVLQLAQLTRSGLVVVANAAQAAFVQNLIYYLCRAYRVADYGIWERGDKGNNGAPERNASSIGLVKAALEASSGLDPFGPHGDGRHTLWVPPDAVLRLRRALEALLPRESASKEVDSGCLAVIGYPSWGVEGEELRARTQASIHRELGGRYGYSRFRRDGHQTVVEDSTRLHYEPEELACFEGIECQWPLFLAFELVTACMEERWQQAEDLDQRLQQLAVQRGEPNDNVPLLWSQSLWLLGQLLIGRWITPQELDPCGRRLPRRPGCQRVRLVLVPGDAAVAAGLSREGLPIVTPGDGDVAIESSHRLAQALALLGRCESLGLSGPPEGATATLAVARLYRCGEQLTAFLPPVLEESTFYLADDPEQLADALLGELRLLQRHWLADGEPLLLVPIAAAPFARRREQVLELARTLASGSFGGVEVQLGTLADHISAAACEAVALPALPPAVPLPAVPLQLAQASGHRSLTVDREQELELESTTPLDLAAQLWGSTSLREQAELLEQLQLRLGASAQLQAPDQALPVPVTQMVEAVYRRSLEAGDWEPVRRCAGLLGLVHPHLEDALDDLLARNRQLVVGRNYTSRSRISEPLDSAAIAQRMRQFSGEDSRETILQQELLLALEGLARQRPALLQGTLTFQLGQLLLLLTSELATERKLGSAEAFEALCALPPHGIFRRVGVVLADLTRARAALQRCEQLHLRGKALWQAPAPVAEKPTGGCWLQH
ncbi:MAG: phosphorylase kinase, partial [Synechococcus sp.]|nr:phosphorylase kinase [Synechococcus sp.]